MGLMWKVSEDQMAYNSEAMNALEGMIDAAGLRNVVWALASICRDKEEHVRHVWQDEVTAKTWERDARKLDHAGSRRCIRSRATSCGRCANRQRARRSDDQI